MVSRNWGPAAETAERIELPFGSRGLGSSSPEKERRRLVGTATDVGISDKSRANECPAGLLDFVYIVWRVKLREFLANMTHVPRLLGYLRDEYCTHCKASCKCLVCFALLYFTLAEQGPKQI